MEVVKPSFLDSEWKGVIKCGNRICKAEISVEKREVKIRNAHDMGGMGKEAYIICPVCYQSIVILRTDRYEPNPFEPMVISQEIDTSKNHPRNTEEQGYGFVKVPGNGYNIGDILFNSGTDSGFMTLMIKSTP